MTFLTICALTFLLILTPAPEVPPMEKLQDWEAFQLSALAEQRGQSGRPYLEFLRVPSMSAGLYVLEADAEDLQRPHREDEMYYIVRGRGVLRVADQDVPVEPGSIVYVKAEVEHRFHSITDDLEVLVFFASGGGN